VIDASVFRRVSLFSELEAGELEALSQLATSRHVPAGAAILREAEPGDQFFVLVKGEVKVFVDSPDGREVVLTHLQAGEFFGEMALLEGESRSASVSALSETELVALSRNDFFAVLSRDFSLTRKILKTLSARLRRANEVIESLALQDVGGRLARYLIRLADVLNPINLCEYDGGLAEVTLTVACASGSPTRVRLHAVDGKLPATASAAC